jgi:hypothetical protein
MSNLKVRMALTTMEYAVVNGLITAFIGTILWAGIIYVFEGKLPGKSLSSDRKQIRTQSTAIQFAERFITTFLVGFFVTLALCEIQREPLPQTPEVKNEMYQAQQLANAKERCMESQKIKSLSPPAESSCKSSAPSHKNKKHKK